MSGASSSSQLPIRPQDLPRQLNDIVYLLHEPAGGKTHLEIIFFHGFMFESSERDFHISSWMSRDGSVCWPAQWLSKDFPSSRIYSVLYDGHLVQTRDRGRMDLRLLGESILMNLTTLAGVGAVYPVILVGHCLGGLVIKQLCVEAAHQIGRREKNIPLECFLQNLRGVFYFSTPHLGSKSLADFVVNRIHYSTNRLSMRSILGPSWTKYIRKSYSHAVEAGASTDHLQELSTAAARLEGDFNNLRQKYNWKSYAVVAVQRLVAMFVGEATARTGAEHCYSDYRANHQTVNKVVSRSSSTYKTLVNFINDCIQEPENKLVSRSSRRFRGSKNIINGCDEESHEHPYQLPFTSDPNYVLLKELFICLTAAIGSAKCQKRVVNLHGGPGTGKSSMAKYVAQHYTDLARNLDKGKSPEYGAVEPDTCDDRAEGWTPDCVFFICCGACSLKDDRDGNLRESDSEIAERLDELIQGLTRWRRRPPHGLNRKFRDLFRDGDPTEIKEGGKSLRDHNRDHLRAILSSPHFDQKVFIILDDVWSKGVFRDFYVPSMSIRYLVTSQIKSVCEDHGLPEPENIRISTPSTDEAFKILFNYIGEISPEKFHGSHTYDELQREVREVIVASGSHPFIIVNFALTMRMGSGYHNPRDWRDAREDLLGFLDDKTQNEEHSPRGYRTLIKSMLMVLESLSPEARRLSILAALWDSPQKIPDVLLRLFMRHVSRGYYLRCIKELEDRSLIQDALDTGSFLDRNKYYSMHSLRREIILQHKKKEVRHVVTTLGNHILPSGSESSNYIFSIDSNVEAAICLVYGGSELRDNVISRYFSEGKTIPWMRSGTNPRELAARAPELRNFIEPLLLLLNSDCGDRSRPMIETIITRYVCHRELDDKSLSELLQLPHLEAVDAACEVASVYGEQWFEHLTWKERLDETHFAEKHGYTMHTLMKVLSDRKATPSIGAILGKARVLDVLSKIMIWASEEHLASFGSSIAYMMNPDSSAADRLSCADFLVQNAAEDFGNLTKLYFFAKDEAIFQELMRVPDNGEGVDLEMIFRALWILLFVNSDIKGQPWHDACGRVLKVIETVVFPAGPKVEETYDRARVFLDLSYIAVLNPHSAVTPFLLDKIPRYLPHLLGNWLDGDRLMILVNLARALESAGYSTDILKVPGLRGYLESELADSSRVGSLYEIWVGRMLERLYPARVNSLILGSYNRSHVLYFGRAIKCIEDNRLGDALADMERGLGGLDVIDNQEIDDRVRILLQSRKYWLKAKIGDLGGALEDIERLISVVQETDLLPAFTAYYTASLILDRGIIKRINSDLAGSLADIEESLRRIDKETHHSFDATHIFDVDWIDVVILFYGCLKHRGYLKHLLGDKEGAVEDVKSARSIASRYPVKEYRYFLKLFRDLKGLSFLHTELIEYLDLDL